AAGALGFPAALDELFYDSIAMLALYFDAAGHDGASAAAFFLELRCERFELAGVQSQPGDHGHTLAFTTGRLAADAHDAVNAFFAGRALPADALGNRAQAI